MVTVWGNLSVDGVDSLLGYLRDLDGGWSSLTLYEKGRDRSESPLGRFVAAGPTDDADGPDPDEDESLEDAAAAWLRAQVEDATRGLSSARFRAYVHAREKRKTFGLTAIEKEALPPDTLEEAKVEIAIRRSEREEGSTEQFHQMLLEGTRQLVEMTMEQAQALSQMQLRAHAQMSEELVAAREQINTLVESIAHERIKSAEQQATVLARDALKLAEDKRVEVNQQLGKQAIDQISSLVGTLMMSQAGVPVDPALAGVLSVLNKSEKLKEALSNPEIQKLLSEPANQEYLASMLTQAAAASSAPQHDDSATQRDGGTPRHDSDASQHDHGATQRDDNAP